MSDSRSVRRKILLALATIPIGAVSMFNLAACDDTDYSKGDAQPEQEQQTNNENKDTEVDRIHPAWCVERVSGVLTEEISVTGGCEEEHIYEWSISREDEVGIRTDDCDAIELTHEDGSCVEQFVLPALPDNAPAEQRANDIRDTEQEWYLLSEDNDRCLYGFSWSTAVCDVGRPLTAEEGEVRAALAQPGESWSIPESDHERLRALPPELRKAVGEMWLKAALFEHASIASFGRVSLELMAHAAPPALLAAVHQAAIDEVRHAQGCFGLASIYLDFVMEPGELQSPPVRSCSLAELAVDTFMEGALEESVAVLTATRALEMCDFEPSRRLLEAIIEEEAAHAALAWATLAWAIEKGGNEVRAALRVAMEEASPSLLTPAIPEPPAAVDICLRKHGRLNAADHHQAEIDAWNEIVEPTLRDLLG